MLAARSLDRSARGVATVDAVVIVPGIMGSALDLVDETGSRQVWGISTLLRNVSRIGSRSRIDALRVRDAELNGELRRIVPTGLLMSPEWLPGFGGMEPYKRLVKTVTETVLHPDAVLLFAYDWRLDVEHNARILAKVAGAHLKRWREHERLLGVRTRRNDDREPRLVVVAHSMGGLLVRAMSVLVVEQPDIRAVVTLGTPFEGSVKTVAMLAGGHGGPRGMSADATRLACLSMPGVYDLLPWYRCRLKDDDVLALDESDLVGLGSASSLARQAFERRARTATGRLPGHRAVVGIGQDTAQSLELSGSRIVTHNWGYRRNSCDELIRESGRLVTENFDGDDTVFLFSARTANAEGIPVAQHHQSLATNQGSLRIVEKVITDTTHLDTVLGGLDETPLGLELLDEVGADQELEIRITSDRRSAEITVAVEDTADRDKVVRRPVVRGRRQEGAFVVRTALDVTGLHRVRVSTGSTEITKLVMVSRNEIWD